jgi:hypothetical protein
MLGKRHHLETERKREGPTRWARRARIGGGGGLSIELLENMLRSKADEPGLEVVHEIGGVLGLAVSVTAFCAANSCGIEAE